ncbi:flagellar filament capping protein FliD [Pseudomonas sp. Marseille-QA0892]
MAGISGVGLGTGINIQSMVESMVAAERAPKESQLAKTEKAATTQITAVGSIKSAVSEFQTALTALDSPSSFLARSVSLSKSEAFTATASASAGIGSYQVEVKQLASNSKVALGAVPATSTFGRGTLDIKVGSASLPPIAIAPPNDTLVGIRDAVNAAGKEQGLNATIVTDKAGARLVLTSNKTGEGEDISVSVSGGDGSGTASLDKLRFSPPAPPEEGSTEVDPPVPEDPAAARMVSRAKSAIIAVDGLQAVSKTNTVDGVIEGVSLNLKATTASDAPITMGVSQDSAGVKGNVQKFVDAYNKLMKTIQSQTNVTKVGDNSAPVVGALVGDASTRTLVSTIRNELVNAQGSGAIRALADLGVTTQKDGTLAIDNAKLSKMVDSNFSDVAALFTGDTGLATRLKGKLDPYTRTGGIFEERNKQLTSTIAKVDTQKADLNRRMESLSERLYKQFNAMDALYSQLSNTTSQLMASLDAMPFANISKK